MPQDSHLNECSSDKTADSLESPERRDMLRRLAKGGAAIPIAAVIYNASTTVAAAS